MGGHLRSHRRHRPLQEDDQEELKGGGRDGTFSLFVWILSKSLRLTTMTVKTTTVIKRRRILRWRRTLFMDNAMYLPIFHHDYQPAVFTDLGSNIEYDLRSVLYSVNLRT